MRRLIQTLPADPWLLVLSSCAAILAALLLTVLQVDLGLLPAPVGGALVGAALLVAWTLVFRFLMLDTWGGKVWLILHLISLVLILALGGMGMVISLNFAAATLILRQYRPWRLLSPRRRAIGFGMGILCLVALFFIRRFYGEGTGILVVDRLRQLGGWSLGGLVFFWLGSLFHLALRMRLHFMRIRPKLAVSAVLIGVVPLVLVVVLGLMILYTGLGGSRAVRASETLESWRQVTAAGGDLSGALFDTTFVWQTDAPLARDGVALVPASDVIPDLAEALNGFFLPAKTIPTGDQRAAVTDTTEWFAVPGGIWLVRWSGLGGDSPSAQGWLLGVKPLKSLSRILRAGIDISSINATRENGELNVTTASDEEKKLFPGMKVSYRDIDPDSPFWDRFLYFGGTLFSVLRYRDGGLDESHVFINLKVGWPEMRADFFEGDSNLNIAVMVSLGLMAVLFLVLEIFALFFGVRISEGIVGAVHSLHRGTKALAGGDLDTRITLPNEDEFGDLAESFNEMTVAIEQGRRVALANERLTLEMATARGIQERLLPGEAPLLNGYEIAGASIPSREIGGDYYDFLVQGEDLIGVAIGDVSGKGMPAALLMSNLQASLHGQVLHPGSVAGVVQRVNDLIVRSTDPHMFATFFYGLLDTGTGIFTCTNAGHNPPLLLHGDGRFEELTKGGLLLGMLGDQTYKQDLVALEPGDVVVLYTDGITEAVGPGVEEDDPEAMFGEIALQAVLTANRNLPAVGLKDAILAAVAAHTLGMAQSDDITLVVIKRQE